MNVTDYFLIAGFALSAVLGALRGFLREAISLAAWIIALFVAWHFSDLVTPHLGGLLAGSGVRTWVARGVIVIAILLLGAFIGVAVSHFVRLSIFSGTDRFLGLIFGVLRAMVLVGVFVMLGQLLRLQEEPWWRQSLLVPYGESLANGLRTVVGEQRLHLPPRRISS